MFNVSDGLERIPNDSSFPFMKKTEWHKMRWRKRDRELEGVALQYWRRHGGEIKLAGSACRECTIYKCDNHIIRLIWNSALKVTHDWRVQDFVEAKIWSLWSVSAAKKWWSKQSYDEKILDTNWVKKRIPLKCDSVIADSSQVPHQKLTIWLFFCPLMFCYVSEEEMAADVQTKSVTHTLRLFFMSCHPIKMILWFLMYVNYYVEYS